MQYSKLFKKLNIVFNPCSAYQKKKNKKKKTTPVFFIIRKKALLLQKGKKISEYDCYQGFYQYIKNNEKVICIEYLRDLLESGSCPTLH